MTRLTPDAAYIGHIREHVAGAPRHDPDQVGLLLQPISLLRPPAVLRSTSSMVTSAGDKSAAEGTYPPRRCGIATFTRNLADSIGLT